MKNSSASASSPVASEITEDNAPGEECRLYEICILHPFPFSKNEEQSLLKDIENLFGEAGATVRSQDRWGRRGLAYPIREFLEGNFIIYYLDILPSRIRELDEALRIHQSVLRHLIVKPPKDYEIISYTESFAQWQKECENKAAREQLAEEERVKKQILERTRKKAEHVEKKIKREETKPMLKKEELQERLDEIISDQDINL